MKTDSLLQLLENYLNKNWVVFDNKNPLTYSLKLKNP